MTERLLDRQSRLIHYLTNGDAIFGIAGLQSSDSALQGFDANLLRIEARFSFEKRLQKIAAVFPRTFDLLHSHLETLKTDFANMCPPFALGQLENAGQFYGFLSDHWERHSPLPSHLPDLAACELALATARFMTKDGFVDEARFSNSTISSVRRSRAIVLLRTTYDVRSLFEAANDLESPVARDVALAIVAQPNGEKPKILQLAPAVFDLLSALDDWVDYAMFDQIPDAPKLSTELATAGLLEMRS